MCHSSVNPIMGCDGSEPWQLANVVALQIRHLLRPAIPMSDRPWVEDVLAQYLSCMRPSELHQKTEMIGCDLVQHLHLDNLLRHQIEEIIHRECTRYTQLFGSLRTGPLGYADAAEVPKQFQGRMTTAAQWMEPTTGEIEGKPWLEGLPRIILISDLEEIWPPSKPIDELQREIIKVASSPAGQRHVWLWMSNRPDLMAVFGDSVFNSGARWPDNLVAMTTVTGPGDVHRGDALRYVPAKLRGLVLEPLTEPVELDLRGIDWLVVGGGSNVQSGAFDIEWALDLQQQCRAAGVAFFIKQLGCHLIWPEVTDFELDPDGGDWSQWPTEWRVREFPAAFRHVTTGQRPARIWGTKLQRKEVCA